MKDKMICSWKREYGNCIIRGFSRLAKPEKTEFTDVNEYFEGKRNAENTLLGNFKKGKKTRGERVRSPLIFPTESEN